MRTNIISNAIGIGAFLVASILPASKTLAQSIKQQSKQGAQSMQISISPSVQAIGASNLSETPVSQANNFLKSTFQLSDNDKLVLTDTKTDELGFTHYKYKQVYKGLDVDLRTVTLHVKDGKIKRYSSNYLSVNDLDVNPILSETEAFKNAKTSIESKKYAWEADKNIDLPKGELVIIQSSYSEQVHLAYKFDIYSYEPIARAYVYVDAKSGKIVAKHNRIHHIDVPASGSTLFNGTQSFVADSAVTDTFYLKQTTNGNGIETYSANNQWGWWWITDIKTVDKNTWEDRTAVSAHWGAEQTHDYYLTKHGRNSYDGAGSKIISYVHIGVNYINAFWNGVSMNYGDGDSTVGPGYAPLVALDICGHEITHGVTTSSANLIYEKESGALNESFSDIFGEAVERNATGSNNWQLGTDIGVNASGAIRSMDNPNAFNDPDTYGGTYWLDPVGCIPNPNLNDNCGVHINSGVQNKWFYILSEGESGTNDNGYNYNVTGIGFDKAAAIAFRNLTVYLTPTSTFKDARLGSIAAAEDLYGVASTEANAVDSAWKAVGVFDNSSPVCAKSLYATTNQATTIAFFGYYFDVKAVNTISVHDFLVDYFSIGSPLTDSIEVYTTPGSYTTSAGSLAGWTYVGKATLTTDGLGSLQQLNLNADVRIPGGCTQAFAFVNRYGIASGNQNSGLVSSNNAPAISASNPDLLWLKGTSMASNYSPGPPNYLAVWGEICYDVVPECTGTSVSFKLYGLNKLWKNAGANDDDVFYHGITQWKRVRANFSGGVGPFTYTWCNSEGYELKNQNGNQIYLFEPAGPSWMICTRFDQGAGCATTDSVFVGFSDEYYCGTVSDPWQLKMCVSGTNTCMSWATAKAALLANTATLGDCPPTKTTLSNQVSGITLYPNPSNGSVTVVVPIQFSSKGTISIVDVNGRLVYTDDISLEKGTFNYNLDASNLSNGIYTMRIQSDQEQFIERMIIQH